MKRCWIVYVGAGPGHELHNSLSDCDFFGPFTQPTAEGLEAELNKLLHEADPDDPERLTASAMPLEQLMVRELLTRYRKAKDLPL